MGLEEVFSGKRPIQIWKLEQFGSIDQIDSLLKVDYCKESEGIKLRHQWIPSDGKNPCSKFTTLETIVDGNKIQYMAAFAVIETLRDRELLSFIPRDKATLQHDNAVLFVECYGSLMAIVSASGNFFSKIRSNLMYIKQSKQNLWGPIEFKGLPLGRSFFYWLLSMKGKALNIKKETYKLVDVKGFKSATERNRHKFAGSGSSIDDETPVQVMVSTKTDFSGLEIVLTNSVYNLSFFLKEGWETQVDMTTSNKISNGQMNFFEPSELVLKIYLEIIPGLIEAFHSEVNWEKDEQQYRRTIGAVAIKKIMNGTGIEPKEL